MSCAEPEGVWRFSRPRSPELHDLEHGGTRYARSVAEAQGITVIMIVAEVVDPSLCVVESRCLVIRDEFDATRIEITALADGWVKTRCGDNVAAN